MKLLIDSVKLMNKLDQRGIAGQLVIFLIIFAGIMVGLYLVQHPAIFKPKAAPNLPSAPETSFELELESNSSSPFPDDPTPDSIPPNTKFRVDIYARTDVEASNLFAAKIKFPTDLMEVSEVNTRDSQTFIKNWLEKFYDNSTGDISIVGGIPDPGIKTDSKSPAYLMASIIFIAKKEGQAKLTFNEGSGIYNNSGNINIMSAKKGIDFSIKPIPLPSPSPINSTVLSCSSTLVKDSILGKYPSGEAAYIVKSGIVTSLIANYSPSNAQITWHVKSDTLDNLLNGNNVSWSVPVNNTTSQQKITIKSVIKSDNQTSDCPDLLVLLDLPGDVSASPSPSPTQQPMQPKRDGDINRDEKFDLSDASNFLTQFNAGKKGVVSEADLAPQPNGDGVVNSFDFSMLRTILLNKGVIRETTGNPVSSPSPSPSMPPASPAPVNSATDTSYDMGVLVIKYFPVTSNGLIDISVTGDIGDPYDVIRKKTEDVTNQLKISLEKASSYLGYKDPNAKAALRYTIVDTKEYKQAFPIKARQGLLNYPDYFGVLTSNNICDYVNSKNVKEVWLWAYQGPPTQNANAHLSIYESKMSGPFGDISNSGRENDMPNCGKTYRVYTFNYQRYTSEALESWGHQLESEMDAIDRTLYRDKFQGSPHPLTTNETGRCGSVHNPPNARSEYDRGNPTPNRSDCLDWKPDGLGALSNISCQNWGCSDADSITNNAHLNYQIWLLQNMPGRGNTKTYQGKQLRNWWDIHGDFDNVMRNSKKLTL